MAGEQDTAALMAEFLEFKAARDAAAAADSDPDNDRDVTIQGAGGTMISIPWRKAREYDLDGFLEGMGLKRRQAPASGGDSDGGTGKGGKAPAAGSKDTSGQGSGAATVANLFRTGKQGKAS